MGTRIEGRGNGIKTNMVNVCDIARSLKTNPAYITKFLGGELGALSNYSFEEEKSIVNGAHETSTGQTLIDKFIDKFVLCPNCKLPETDMMVKKDFLRAGCKACGWSGDLDNSHKLVKFILQNPPGADGAAAGGKKGKKDRAERQAARALFALAFLVHRADGVGSSKRDSRGLRMSTVHSITVRKVSDVQRRSSRKSP